MGLAVIALFVIVIVVVVIIAIAIVGGNKDEKKEPSAMIQPRTIDRDKK